MGTVTLTSISAMDLISSSQLIGVSLLFAEVLEMFIRTHITCAVRALEWVLLENNYSKNGDKTI